MLKRGTILVLLMMTGLVRAEPATQPSTQPSNPVNAMTDFIDAAIAGDVPKMASLLADGDDDKLRARLQRMSDDITNGGMSLSVMETIAEDDVATVIVKTSKRNRERPEAIPLVKMGTEWKLVMEPRTAAIDPDQVTRLEAVLKRGTERARELRQQMAPPPPTTQPVPQP